MWCATDNDEEEPAIQEGLDAEAIALLGGKDLFCNAYEANLTHILPMQRKYVFDDGVDYQDMEVAVLHDIGAGHDRILAALKDGQGDTGRKLP